LVAIKMNGDGIECPPGGPTHCARLRIRSSKARTLSSPAIHNRFVPGATRIPDRVIAWSAPEPLTRCRPLCDDAGQLAAQVDGQSAPSVAQVTVSGETNGQSAISLFGIPSETRLATCVSAPVKDGSQCCVRGRGQSVGLLLGQRGGHGRDERPNTNDELVAGRGPSSPSSAPGQTRPRPLTDGTSRGSDRQTDLRPYFVVPTRHACGRLSRPGSVYLPRDAGSPAGPSWHGMYSELKEEPS